MVAGSRPTSVSAWATMAVRSARERACPCTTSPSAMMSAMVMRGESEPYGS